METVVVTDVNDKGNGWFDVSLADGRTASTKDKKVAETAFQSRNNPIQAEIAEKKKGNFTNVYLNKIETTENGGSSQNAGPNIPPVTTGTNTAVGVKPTNLPSYEDKQARIAAQWAYGRAVELFREGFDGASASGLDDGAKASITADAEWLLAQSIKLAEQTR